MTQKELAEALNISESAIAMYEIGERTPTLKKAKMIADFFNVPLESINFFWEKRSHNESNLKGEQTA